MDFVLRDEIKSLMQMSEGPSVSLYMPTHRAGQEVQQDPIRLSNLLRDAEKQLLEVGLRAADARDLLHPAHRLEGDSIFWRTQWDGLALFISPHLFRIYRLPLHFNERAVVSDRFHLKPLLPLFNGDGRFFVLALSQKDIRLLECTRYGVKALPLNGTPRSMEEALHLDDLNQQNRSHTRVTGTQDKRGDMFRGHGAGDDNAKTDVLRYLLKVNDGLHDHVLKDEKAPLVLAGVEYLLPLYKEANSYPYLYEQGITGNPEGLSPQELHEQAWKVVEPVFRKAQETARERYMNLLGSAQASNDLKEIVPAACYGRVEALFVPSGSEVWGLFNREDNTIQIHEKAEPGDDDLLGIAAVEAFLNGAEVFVTEPEGVPGGSITAAIFRY